MHYISNLSFADILFLFSYFNLFVPVWQIDLLVHSRIEDFPAILMYAEIFGTMVISYDEAFE